MTKTFENIFSAILEADNIKNIELYEKLSKNKDFKIESPNDFYFNLVYPFESFLEGYISKTFGKDLEFLLMNLRFIELQFETVIVKLEGTTCSADKSRCIVNSLFHYFLNPSENKITFDWQQKYTYHYCTKCFNSEEKILDFYNALRSLFYGNPTKYLKQLQNIYSL